MRDSHLRLEWERLREQRNQLAQPLRRHSSRHHTGLAHSEGATPEGRALQKSIKSPSCTAVQHRLEVPLKGERIVARASWVAQAHDGDGESAQSVARHLHFHKASSVWKAQTFHVASPP